MWRATLRVALLTFLELAENGQPRALLHVGGATLAHQQVSVALALMCERIVCIAKVRTQQLISIQHAAEARGAQFHVVDGLHALTGLVAETDHLLVLDDGLLASLDVAVARLGGAPVILTQPADQGLAAGFERLDLTLASAGAMIIPGSLIARVIALPADCDPASALLRLALQTGVPTRSIGSGETGTQVWTVLRSETDAHTIEPIWIRDRTETDDPSYPTRILALAIVRRMGASLLHAGSGAAHLAIASAMLVALALAAGWLGYFAVGLIFCAIGWLCREIASLLARIAPEGLDARNQMLGYIGIYRWLVDAVIIALLGWGTNAPASGAGADQFFPAFILIALVRIVPGFIDRGWTAWLWDRSLFGLGLGVAVASGWGSSAIYLAAVALSVVAIWFARAPTRLTRP